MSMSIANVWNTTYSKDVARDIASISGLYCGPAVVGWIAAVWKHHNHQRYDYMSRLNDKRLFPDGPRDFTGKSNLPKFQNSLKSLLLRETNNELTFDGETYRKYGTLHDELEKHDMPIAIRMQAPNFTDGLHYVTLYKSEKKERDWKEDRIQFYWQDNGFYGNDGGNPGLHQTDWRNVGQHVFFWGAKRVRKTFLGIAKDLQDND